MHKRVITPSAKHSLKKLPRAVKDDLLKATEVLEINPLAGEKLSGILHFYIPSISNPEM